MNMYAYKEISITIVLGSKHDLYILYTSTRFGDFILLLPSFRHYFMLHSYRPPFLVTHKGLRIVISIPFTQTWGALSLVVCAINYDYFGIYKGVRTKCQFSLKRGEHINLMMNK